MIKIKNKLKIFALCLLTSFIPFAASAAVPDYVDVEDIKSQILTYMNVYKVPGAQVMIQVGKDSYSYSFGYTDFSEKNKVTAQTIFELGSITKTFTGLLLAKQIQKRKMKLYDKLSKYVSGADSKSIKALTLKTLVTHTSGLPFEVTGLSYNAAHTVANQLVYEKFLQTWAATHLPGRVFLYSNIAFSLLGDVLAASTDMKFSDLIKTNILDPLGMHSSMLSVTENVEKYYAQGYTAKNVPARMPTEGLLGASWAMKASGDDMAKYLKAVMGYKGLSPAMDTARKMAETSYYQQVKTGQELGFGWMIMPLNRYTPYKRLLKTPAHLNMVDTIPVHKMRLHIYNAHALIDKLGATDGFRAYIGFIPDIEVGIVILTNKYTPNTGALQNIGRAFLLDPIMNP